MHKTQQLTILIGIALILLMSIYPPWLYVDNNKVEHPMGYAPIWKPPIEVQRDTAKFFGLKLELNVQTQAANTIDIFRLLIQIAILAAVTGGTVVLLKRA